MATILDFDEIHRLGNTLAVTYRDPQDIDRLIESFSSFLTSSFVAGTEAAGEMLAVSAKVNMKEAEASVYRPVGGKTFADRLRDGDGDPGRLMETEYHRVYVEAMLLVGQKSQNGELSSANPNALARDVQKTWVTMKDPRVRATHEFLEGVTVPLDTEYVTFDGDRAQGPGGFSRVENNANCRCLLELSWA